MRILIVEDEPSIADGLKFNFEQEGYETQVVTDGPTALALLLEGQFLFDLIVLDLMLPGMSGYEICKEIRGFSENIPVMVLSARSSSEDKAHAFDCGADQYVTNPFDLNEVLSRVRNLFKWRSPDNSDTSDAESQPVHVYQFDDVSVDCRKFQVTVKGEVFTLTTMEMQLLRYFLENQGMVLSRSRIMEDVWSQSPDITTRTIDNFVMRLRRIIEPDSSKPKYIVSVRGTGYKFVRERAVSR
ncbi:MAG: response regulator transcription factor [Mariniblastus sp.]|nr:response regulator transcription factor [Mariniblastus sp.]